MSRGGELHKVFAGGLPADATKDDLQYVFNTYGNVVDVHIMAGRSNSGQVCAFIAYDTRIAGDTAIASLDGVYSMRDDGSAPIRVSWARPNGGSERGSERPPPQTQAPPPRYSQPARSAPQASYRSGNGAGPPVSPQRPAGGGGGGGGRSGYGGGGGGGWGGGGDKSSRTQRSTKLFVGNLPSDISQDALSMVFGHYGKVTDVHIMNGKARSGQACAFVEYNTPLEAETAVLTLHEQYEIRPGDGTIMVKFAQNPNPGRGPY